MTGQPDSPQAVVFRALAEAHRLLAVYLYADTPGDQWRRRVVLADTEPARRMRKVGRDG